MIRSNVDVIAVSVLIAAAALFSAAQQSPALQKAMAWNVLSNRTVVWQRVSRGLTVKPRCFMVKNGSRVKVVQLPALSCVRD